MLIYIPFVATPAAIQVQKVTLIERNTSAAVTCFDVASPEEIIILQGLGSIYRLILDITCSGCRRVKYGWIAYG